METLTKPNKHTLARRGWPQNEERIYCLINGVAMVSMQGYHASISAPKYAYIDKMVPRNTADKPARLDFEVSDQQVTVVASDDEHATLSNGVKLNQDYAAYYLNAYPKAKWYNAGPFKPVAIIQAGRLVAVIMPLNSN